MKHYWGWALISDLLISNATAQRMKFLCVEVFYCCWIGGVVVLSWIILNNYILMGVETKMVLKNRYTANTLLIHPCQQLLNNYWTIQYVIWTSRWYLWAVHIKRVNLTKFQHHPLEPLELVLARLTKTCISFCVLNKSILFAQSTKANDVYYIAGLSSDSCS